MTYFEFRELLESAVPWWVPFVVPLLVATVCYAAWLFFSERDKD